MLFRIITVLSHQPECAELKVIVLTFVSNFAKAKR